MWLEAIHSASHHEESCPTCGSGVRKRIFGEMHAGSFVLDGLRVEIRRVPDEGFVDPIVLDGLTQYFRGCLYRMWPSDRYYSKGGSRLHRDAWTAAFGPIPKGCHIHHRNGNVADNRIENLECIDAKEHARIERKAGSVHGESKLTPYAREKAAEWHRSPEGREWHKRHAERSQSWTKWKRETRCCLECSAEFMALIRKSGNQQVYCTSACKVAAYRKRGKQAEWEAAYRAREAAKRDG